MGSTSSKAHGTSWVINTVVLLIANFGHSQDPFNRLTKLLSPMEYHFRDLYKDNQKEAPQSGALLGAGKPCSSQSKMGSRRALIRFCKGVAVAV